MERLAISQEVSRILNEYNPHTTKFELESWVQDQLEWCYADLSCPSLETSIKYQGVHIKFLRESYMFNVIKLTENSELIECTIPLRNFIEENYGVENLTIEDCGVRFASCDFELMAIQLTEMIVDWCAHVELVDAVERMFPRKQNQKES